jgi:hypothetical protein
MHLVRYFDKDLISCIYRASTSNPNAAKLWLAERLVIPIFMGGM